MPFLAAFIASAIGRVIIQILIALGIGYVSYQGADAVISYAGGLIEGYLSVLPDQAGQMVAILQIRQCVQLILAGSAARAGAGAATRRLGLVK